MALSVAAVLPQMQDAVKTGKMVEAAGLGERCTIPLSISPSDIQFDKMLSEGAESEVYSGKYLSEEIAIKKPFIRTTQDLLRFREELKMNCSLQHEHIIPITGGRLIPPNYFFCMPLEGDSYYNLLHTHKCTIEWETVIRVGMEMASAIQHVHENEIIHRDIKTRNILQGKDGKAKLIDFGISQFLSETKCQQLVKPTGGFHKAKLLGTLEYMSPEVLQKKGHTFASDVYSFAVSMNEIATGIYPFCDCNKDNPDAHTVLEMGYGRQELAAAVAAEGLRPTLPKDCPTVFTDLMNACWDLDPQKRPTIEQIAKQFQLMNSSFTSLNFPKLCQPLPSFQNTVPVPEPVPEVEEEGGKWIVEAQREGYRPQILGGVFATAGFRGEDRMEDRHVLEHKFGDHEETAANSSLFALFDGHRGPEASEFAKEHISTILKQKLSKGNSIEAALQKTFLEVEHRFEHTPFTKIEDKRGDRFPGTTALAAFFLHDKLYLANAGDCRAVLCRNGMAVQVTRDHIADDETERQRVLKLTSDLKLHNGSWRIGGAGLDVTRSLGDTDLKPDIVTADPEITTYTLTADDEFLILGTDGLWDAISNQEAIRLVFDTVKSPNMSAKRIAMEALTLGSQDNITVIVIFLKNVSSLEKVFSNGTAKYANLPSGRKALKPAVAADEISETL